jgi:transcriptional regulator with XRE-family HTH domain
MSNQIEKYRQEIAKKIRQLRQDRQWTQKELAKLLGLSQNRLSEIEGGEGSFTAEQLLLLSINFNVSVSDFVSAKGKTDQKIQNALARLGASHLAENKETLPSEDLDNVANVVREVLISPKSSRHVTALAPILVNYAKTTLLNQLRLQSNQETFVRRYRWLLENIQWAIKEELDHNLPNDQKVKYKKAEFVLDNLLKTPWFGVVHAGRVEGEDVFDSDINSEKTLDDLRKSSSKISKRLKIVTRIQPEDFASALKEARETR